MKRFNPKDFEKKWQKHWADNKTYVADLDDHTKPKYFGMDMFNYPSALGLHIGHAFSFTVSDVISRFHRQKGFNTFLPVGWDSFGLPAENYAVKVGRKPQLTTAEAIENYKNNYIAMGFSRDWSREINTCQPEYYKWNQWLFLKLFENGLVYQASAMQWWCDNCQTVLANEQVTADGKCWRHDTAEYPEIAKKEIKQWFFKVTEYADELLEAIDDLDWTNSVKLAQKNWIGKSKGAEVIFQVASEKEQETSDEKITVFTTRPDTLFGATFLVLAPEHELVNRLTVESEKSKVQEYIKQSVKKTDVERQASKEKTGVFTGLYAINPVNKEKIPIWVADYVLAGYGTGAIMAVPAHDDRDKDFASKFELPIKQVVAPDYGTKRAEEKFADGGCAIIFDPASQKYVFGKIPNGNIVLFAGGVEEGESIKDAVSREVLEESGLTDVRLLEEVGVAYGHYYHSLKKLNRVAKAHCFLAVLDSDVTTDKQLQDYEHFETVKMSAAEILKLWQLHPEGDYDHYVHLLKLAVSRAIELGLDKDSDKRLFAEELVTGEGILVYSGEYSGLTTSEAREKIVNDLAKEDLATEKTIYKMRDWSISRQRYWGTPIPVINCPSCGPVNVPENDLPVVLPELEDFQPSGDGRSALARAVEWKKVDCPKCGGQAERETETMDTFVDSSWYMFRYLSPDDDKQPFDPEQAKNWFPVDFYDGADHATMHLLYSRFITRFFYKLGMSPTPEPFKKFLFHGKVTASDGTMFSKSKGNGVDPLEIINSGYGADALRTYLMFAAPLDLWVRWDPQGVPGTYRFLNRVWNITQEYLESDKKTGENTKVLRAIHPTIKKVTGDIEELKYNTAIATLMKCVNDLYELKAKEGFQGQESWGYALKSLAMLIAPFAPHTAEELWVELGQNGTIHKDNWPEWDDKYLISDNMTIAVQVNGKLRGTVEVATDSDKDKIIETVLNDEKIKAHLNGEPKKTIYVPGKLVSLVV